MLRAVQPGFYGAAMRLRRLAGNDEVEALVPFDSRVHYQHMPLRGRDGFLFHRDHDAHDQLSATIVLRERQIRIWTEALESRFAWCRDNGAAARFLIIPEKHVVYADKLPLFTRVSPHRPAMQLLGALQGTVKDRTIYPVDALKAASLVQPTYLRTDTHWNAHGAHVAYRALTESLRDEIALETVAEDDLTWRQRPFVGDLGVRFAREQGESRSVLVQNPDHALIFQNHNFGRGAVHVYENKRRDLPHCVLFRDSFSNALIPYLMHGFSRLVAVSSLSCHYDLLEQEKPDVVLFAAIERFLATFGRGQTIEVPDDAARRPFVEFSGTPLEHFATDAREPWAAYCNFEAFAPWNIPPLVLNDHAATAESLPEMSQQREIG